MDKPKPVHSVISITPHNNTNRFITHLMKNVLIGCLVVLAGCNKVLVRFEVKVQGNAESVFITGDHQELGTWNPGEVEMKKSSDSLFIHQIAVKSGTNLEYKFTQGSWNSEAIYETDIVPANHMLTVGTDTTVVHTVRKWKDELVTSYESITGSVVIHEELFSPELNNGRTVLVWLPPSYEII
ncbi:MAG TPA: carbohydrate-binding module family 20 domain-containing protein, partial [Candidatus Marinimicrobia bacterium]|nr:carbohydrate-binding module family 20 domain-containing protein [Candidatus Neomarinimicrobiota bacterium]